mmetsp:Transcript_5094/g.10359  ORF Transcript_5094/g.10359 Transcript_5094/m.10359 type:complete len:273 (+) Transcript_5094:175-993(+)
MVVRRNASNRRVHQREDPHAPQSVSALALEVFGRHEVLQGHLRADQSRLLGGGHDLCSAALAVAVGHPSDTARSQQVPGHAHERGHLGAVELPRHSQRLRDVQHLRQQEDVEAAAQGRVHGAGAPAPRDRLHRHAVHGVCPDGHGGGFEDARVLVRQHDAVTAGQPGQDPEEAGAAAEVQEGPSLEIAALLQVKQHMGHRVRPRPDVQAQGVGVKVFYPAGCNEERDGVPLHTDAAASELNSPRTAVASGTEILVREQASCLVKGFLRGHAK